MEAIEEQQPTDGLWNDPLNFTGKVALVTGASSGMGLATARAFAEAGAFVALADLKEEAVCQAAEQLGTEGHRALAIVCDVSDDAQVEAMVKKVVAEFGRLDAAFNVREICGVYSVRRIEDELDHFGGL